MLERESLVISVFDFPTVRWSVKVDKQVKMNNIPGQVTTLPYDTEPQQHATEHDHDVVFLGRN